jgi:Ca-activated chloride channel family protein
MKSLLFLVTLASIAAAAEPIEISAKAESALIAPGETSAHVLVRLRAGKAPEAAGPLKLNLALVIDRSGSMSGAKIEDARAAAVAMVKKLNDGDRVAIVSYSDEVRVDAESTVVNEASRAKLLEAIAKITDDGSTNLGGGLTEGLAQVSKNLAPAGVNRVLLISDGLANRGIQEPRELNRIARESLQKGIITTTIGLGTDYNEDLMTGIADHGGGNYYFVADSTKIEPTLNDEVRQMAATVARDVALVVNLTGGIKVEKVHGWVPREEGETFIVPLGDFFSGQLRSVLWKFKLPAGLKEGSEVVLGPIELTCNAAGESGKLHRLTTEPIHLKVSGDKAAVLASRDQEVTARIAEIELATSMESASQLVADGKYDEAKVLLTRAVANAKDKGAALAPAAASDLVKAAEAAEKMQQNVGQAATSGERAKAFTKGGKAEAQMLRKK